MQRKNCVNVCTDGAASVMGKSKGFISAVERINPIIQITPYFLHREALMAKTLPDELKEVIDTAVKLVHFIKTSSLESRLFEILGKEMGADYKDLLLHAEVRLLSRGRVFLRIYELKKQIMLFLANQRADFKHHLVNEHWWSKLACLVIGHFNMLNTKMQGKNESVLTTTDKLGAFQLKLNLWRKKAEKGVLEMFPFIKAAVAEIDDLPVLKESNLQLPVHSSTKAFSLLY